MGENKAEMADRVLVTKSDRAGRALAKAQSEMVFQEADAGMIVRQVKLVQRGGGWLLVMAVQVDGIPKVAFRDLVDLVDLPEVMLTMLRESKWRADKYANPGTVVQEK